VRENCVVDSLATGEVLRESVQDTAESGASAETGESGVLGSFFWYITLTMVVSGAGTD